jgi:Ca2+-binding EF-hand superfamily protein
MKSTTLFWRSLFLSAALAGASVSYAQAAPARPDAALAAFDTDKDGTLSWDEVSVAATAKFDAADTDHEGTLDAREAATLGIGKTQLAKGDPDKDGTLDRDEYLALVKKRFDAADTDHDGTLSHQELATVRGRSVLRLIQ